MCDPKCAEFFIVDIRPEWRKKKYVTLWRQNNAGYCWSVPWAGRYDIATVIARLSYYLNKGGGKQFIRWPVPCCVIERLATQEPRPGDIDGNVGPVLMNDAATRRALRAARPAFIKEAA